MILAVPVAVARMAEFDLIRWIAQGYIELFRCTPMLVQLFWIYFALPALTGVTIPGFASAVIALTANLTAFMAEAYRSGFQAVPVEQIEAGKMLRLNATQPPRRSTRRSLRRCWASWPGSRTRRASPWPW
jgi:polar amino acid transport system permease protein